VEAEEDEEEEEERDDDSSSKLMFCSRAIFSISRWGFQATIISKISRSNSSIKEELERRKKRGTIKIRRYLQPCLCSFVFHPKDQDLEKPRDGVLGHGWPRCRNKDPHVLYMRWGESEERLHEESVEEGHV
jgi:hypothetical protein